MARGNPSLGGVAFSLDKEDCHDSAHVLLKVLQNILRLNEKALKTRMCTGNIIVCSNYDPVMNLACFTKSSIRLLSVYLGQIVRKLFIEKLTRIKKE